MVQKVFSSFPSMHKDSFRVVGDRVVYNEDWAKVVSVISIGH